MRRPRRRCSGHCTYPLRARGRTSWPSKTRHELLGMATSTVEFRLWFTSVAGATPRRLRRRFHKSPQGSEPLRTLVSNIATRIRSTPSWRDTPRCEGRWPRDERVQDTARSREAGPQSASGYSSVKRSHSSTSQGASHASSTRHDSNLARGSLFCCAKPGQRDLHADTSWIRLPSKVRGPPRSAQGRRWGKAPHARLERICWPYSACAPPRPHLRGHLGDVVLGE